MSLFELKCIVLIVIAFTRHFISWIGSLPATKENFKELLRKGSLAVVVGGIAEVSVPLVCRSVAP
jgi:2-acylglycerol O-acyltransferase 2